MHFAVHGHTAAEIIVERADADKEYMGLTTWENAPDGKIVKSDVSIAKNYLSAPELEDMGKLVNSVLDMAERMANRHIPMTMEDWANRINILYLRREEIRSLMMRELLQRSLQRNSQSPSLRNTVSFRIGCFSRTLTD